MTGRLIDADKAVHDLGRSLCDSVHELEAINVVASQPTVEAIPIEWVKKWMDRQDSWNREGVITLIRDWNEEKEK